MDKNFRVRVICAVGLLLVAIIALFAFDSIPFKILFGLFAVVAGVELLSFFERRFTILNAILAMLEIAFLIFGTMFIAKIDVFRIWLIIFGVCGYDVFAYLVGHKIGGKIFKKSRPFPHISKNKTWEGTFGGLFISVSIVLLVLYGLNRFGTDSIYLLCGPFALVGDLFESALKRCFKVKDSNEIVIKTPFFKKLELVVGGSEGHGGFLDRIDSTAFTASVLLLISVLV